MNLNLDGAPRRSADLDFADDAGAGSAEGDASRPGQKWLQCARCHKWRKVPFNIDDEALTDEWECGDNSWDRTRAACTVPQELSNDEIDDMLAQDEAAASGMDFEEEG